MGTTNDTELIAEATARAMLEEWLSSYDVETRCYNSGALEAEVFVLWLQIAVLIDAIDVIWIDLE